MPKSKEKRPSADNILQDLTDRHETTKQIKVDEKIASDKHWRQFLMKGEDDNDTKIYTPKTYTNVWISVAKFINLFVGSENIYEITPRGTKDEKEAKIKTACLNYETSQIPDFKMVQVKQILQYVVDGWNVFKVGWDKEREGLLYPFIKNEDISMDPTATLMSDVEWANQRIIKSKAQLLAQERTGIYKGITEFLKKATEYKKDKLRIDESNPYRDKYELYECWTKDRILVVGGVAGEGSDSSVVFTDIFRDDPNPSEHGRIPYEIAAFDPNLDDLKGMGIPEITRGSQIELDAARRLHHEASENSIMGIWAYKVGRDKENLGYLQDFINHPKAGGFPLDDFDSLKRLDQAPNQTIFLEEKMFRDDMDDASACHPPISGALLPRKEPLGVVKMQQSAGNERHSVRLLLFSIALRSVGQLMLKNLFQYHTKEVEVKIFDGDEELWVNRKMISKKDIKKNYDLILNIAPTTQSKAEQQEKLLKAMEVVSRLPEFEKQVDMELLGRMMFTAIDPKLKHQIILNKKDAFLKALAKVPTKELQTVISVGYQTLESQGQVEHQNANKGAQTPPVAQLPPPVTTEEELE